MFEREVELFSSKNLVKLALPKKDSVKLYDSTDDKIFEKYTKKVIRRNLLTQKEIDFSFNKESQENYYISFDDFILKLQFNTIEELFYYELKYC